MLGDGACMKPIEIIVKEVSFGRAGASSVQEGRDFHPPTN